MVEANKKEIKKIKTIPPKFECEFCTISFKHTCLLTNHATSPHLTLSN